MEPLLSKMDTVTVFVLATTFEFLMTNAGKTQPPVRKNSIAWRSKSKLIINSFLVGIGGFELRLQRAEIRPASDCEIQGYCNRVLQHHWPQNSCVRDIRRAAPPKLAQLAYGTTN